MPIYVDPLLNKTLFPALSLNCIGSVTDCLSHVPSTTLPSKKKKALPEPVVLTTIWPAESPEFAISVTRAITLLKDSCSLDSLSKLGLPPVDFKYLFELLSYLKSDAKAATEKSILILPVDPFLSSVASSLKFNGYWPPCNE